MYVLALAAAALPHDVSMMAAMLRCVLLTFQAECLDIELRPQVKVQSARWLGGVWNLTAAV